MQMVFKRLLVSLSITFLAACSDKAPQEFELTREGVKSLDSSISAVEITPQIDGRTQYVDLQVRRDPVLGGGSEWNGIAHQSRDIFGALLAKPNVSRARIVFISPENNNLDWAQVRLARKNLPVGWHELSPLELFAHSEPLAGSLEALKWLCDFYRQYKSAVPPEGLPVNCND